MKKFFRAQSTLEFIMILILVIAGIFVMGPYVIRSVNAYMRSWEISADQAKHDPGVTIEPWEIDPNIPQPCNIVSCTGGDALSCGDTISKKACCVYVFKFEATGGGGCQSAGGKCMSRSVAGSIQGSSGQSCAVNYLNATGDHTFANSWCCYGPDPNPPATQGTTNSGASWCEDKSACPAPSNPPDPDYDDDCYNDTIDGICQSGETYACPDCGSCGDGQCLAPLETATSCPPDCAACSTATCTQQTTYSNCAAQGLDGANKACCVWIKKFICQNSSCIPDNTYSCKTRAAAINSCPGVHPNAPILWSNTTTENACSDKRSCQAVVSGNYVCKSCPSQCTGCNNP